MLVKTISIHQVPGDYEYVCNNIVYGGEDLVALVGETVNLPYTDPADARKTIDEFFDIVDITVTLALDGPHAPYNNEPPIALAKTAAGGDTKIPLGTILTFGRVIIPWDDNAKD